jgi:hypothetical protein
MVAILISTAVSTALLAFAGAVIWREVARNWASVAAALRGAPAQTLHAPAGAPQRAAVRMVRSPRRAQPMRCPPLALAA